jgi:Flp pilus assembly CpaE family ATPase
MMPLTAALVISSRPLWEQVHACVQNLPVRIALEQHEPEDADSLLDRIERHRADVVLIEAARLALPLEEFIGRLREIASQPAVFVLHIDASPQHILNALHAGATEFLYPPLTDKLREAFENLSALRGKNSSSQSGGLGRIFGFLSAKGGCGATTFACHVSTVVARQLRQPVLAADFDFEAGLLRFILKSKSTYSVRDALDNMHRMDASYWKALVWTQGEYLDLIAAPDDLAAKRAAGPEDMAHLMRFLRSVYPVTIVDFGRHFSSAAFDSLPELETLYLVATAEPETLDQAKDCVRMAGERGYDAPRIQVLLNCMPERNAPDLKGIESFLGVSSAGVFINDATSLYEAWSEGHLLGTGSRLGREMNAFGESIVRKARGERPEQKVEVRIQRRLSFFPKFKLTSQGER